MDRLPVGDVEDLATLARLDEHILLEEIAERYKQNKIYVSIINTSSSTRITIYIESKYSLDLESMWFPV